VRTPEPTATLVGFAASLAPKFIAIMIEKTKPIAKSSHVTGVIKFEIRTTIYDYKGLLYLL